MSYTAAEGRQDILDAVGDAADLLASALAALGEAYELVDEHTGDELEDALFGPVQGAYGLARRIHQTFAERSGLPGREFVPGSGGAPSQGAKLLIEHAVVDAQEADRAISELQDSMRPVEVGDPELRAQLAQLREAIDPLAQRARELMRHLGR